MFFVEVETAEQVGSSVQSLVSSLNVVIGALITVIAGFIGAWIQGRREHRRWLRDRRVESYIRAAYLLYSLNQLTQRYAALARKVKEATELGERSDIDVLSRELVEVQIEADHAAERVHELYGESQILYPRKINALFDSIPALIKASDPARLEAKSREILDAMRKELKANA